MYGAYPPGRKPDMKFLLFLSNAMIPLLIFYIVATGLSKKRNIYDDFIKGASDGFRTVMGIMPTLIGLMVAVGVLRASGFLDLITRLLEAPMALLHFPTELVPLTVVKMFSSSAATGLLLDIYKEYGPDSTLGTMASLMMSSTETIFYTMSVYFMAAHVKKSRYTLAGALLATLAGTVASVLLAGLL
jgi:spore maturation protein B